MCEQKLSREVSHLTMRFPGGYFEESESTISLSRLILSILNRCIAVIEYNFQSHPKINSVHSSPKQVDFHDN